FCPKCVRSEDLCVMRKRPVTIKPATYAQYQQQMCREDATLGSDCGPLAVMNCMKRILPASAVVLTALLGINHLAAAQQVPPTGARPATAAPAAPRAAAGRVSGTVTDATTGKPVSYATVAVLDGAGNPVNGGVAGDDGKFVLAGIPAGTYKVQ